MFVLLRLLMEISLAVGRKRLVRYSSLYAVAVSVEFTFDAECGVARGDSCTCLQKPVLLYVVHSCD